MNFLVYIWTENKVFKGLAWALHIQGGLLAKASCSLGFSKWIRRVGFAELGEGGGLVMTRGRE